MLIRCMSWYVRSPVPFIATVRDAYCTYKPNLQPPIASVSQAITYRERLQSLAPNVTFLMTLYLCPSITPSLISDAAKAGITGVKSYPAGVTTYGNSICDLRDVCLYKYKLTTELETLMLGSSIISNTTLPLRLWKNTIWFSTCTAKFRLHRA